MREVGDASARMRAVGVPVAAAEANERLFVRPLPPAREVDPRLGARDDRVRRAELIGCVLDEVFDRVEVGDEVLPAFAGSDRA